ncbi:uncharacterized protein isoform X2 [Leptinotarsa decemlineata]|uniref:uncharacterized protein isoform X2 n=1 Tax=Leptinotarsa decemlineata TaxID=7539 RepID=UPI003D306CAE
MLWKLETRPTCNKNGDVFAEFSLSSDAFTESLWSSQFSILCRITLRERQLEIKLTIENLSKEFPMDFNCMHHAYFKVPDVAKCKIRGLKNCRYFHNQDPEKNMFTELRNEVTISQHTDILYQRISKEMYLDKTGDWEKVLKITKTNLPDMVLWNPWQEMAKTLIGLDEDEYKYFVALDLGIIANRMYLKPQTYFRSTQTYELIEPQNYHRQDDDSYDYFEGIC